MNESHYGVCGGHLFGMSTSQNILHSGYLWTSIFKDWTKSIKKCPPCQYFYPKNCSRPAQLHPVIIVGSFAKRGNDFMHCKPTLTKGMVTLSLLLTILPSGMRLHLHMMNTVILQQSLFLTISLQNLESHRL